MLTEKSIEGALKTVSDVIGDGDIVAENRVENITVEGGSVMITLTLPTEDVDVKRAVEDQCRAAIKAIDESIGVMIMTKGPAPAESGGRAQQRPHSGDDPWKDQAPLPGVRHIIAVSSAKGGVGKSTVCVNLALALQERGAKVGIMDSDVYGPSIHVLLDASGPPKEGKEREVAPIEKYGLKLMSLGFLTERGMPVVWRGPMVMGVVKKFLQDVDWGELDYLLVDMPPGTGDAQITLVQTVPLTGAIIVTTSSELALVDAEKGFMMFRSVDSPVLGIVENMSYFVCPHCNERSDVFGHGEGKEICRRLETEFLGELPLDPSVRSSGDRGHPIVKVDPDSTVTQEFMRIADKIREICPTE